MELVISGHNVTLKIRARQLHITCTGQDDMIIDRFDSFYDSILVDATVGLITVEAITWMTSCGITWNLLSRDRGLIATGQARVTGTMWESQLTYTGLGVTAMLLAAKCEGQARVCELIGCPATAATIRGHAAELTAATSHRQLLGSEGAAARIYWNQWRSKVTVPFTARDLLKVPPRWAAYPGRPSMSRKGTNRHATDPGNALLNLAYTAGEAVCVRACHATGLVPQIGISHRRAPRPGPGDAVRNSMALDLLEAIRPLCDTVVLELLDYGQGIIPSMASTAFLETSEGVVRVEDPGLRRAVLTGVTNLQDEANRYARAVAKVMRGKGPRGVKLSAQLWKPLDSAGEA